MPTFDGSSLSFATSSTPKGRYSDFSAYPQSEEGWRDRYDRLWAAYLGEPYDVSEVKAYHLFRALDDNNAEIDVTRRTFNLYKFIVDTDVGGVLGGPLTLEVADGENDALDTRAALLVAGESVWKRSQVAEKVESWVRTVAALGDHYIEAVRTSTTAPYGTTLVGYDPRTVTPVYDTQTGTKLLKVIVTTSYLDEPTVAKDGTVEDGALHTYRREVDHENVNVYIDGKRASALSGPHGLGVVPVVHVQWSPFTEPDHGLPAAVGIDQAVMACDSMVCQAKAIFNRYANPVGYIKGAKVEGGSDILKFGRFISGIPVDGDIGYLEAGGAMVSQLTEQITQLLDYVQTTEPEFLFADGNNSGEARSYKAAAFENKVGSARTRIFSGLARVTSYAVAMDRNEQADPDVVPFKIEAGPILPRNVKGELDTVNSVKDALTPGDYVRHLQRLGIVGNDKDPEEYAREARGASSAVEPNDSPTVVPDEPVATEDAGTTAPETPAANTALNGAQVQAAQGIVVSVATGQLPRASALAMLVEFFNLSPEAAERVMGEVGRGFVPAASAAPSSPAPLEPAEPEPTVDELNP